MKLGISMLALTAAGIALLAWTAAEVFGPLVWTLAGGMTCFLVVVGTVGARRLVAILMDGARTFWRRS